jgi:hypothetical protein
LVDDGSGRGRGSRVGVEDVVCLIEDAADAVVVEVDASVSLPILLSAISDSASISP